MKLTINTTHRFGQQFEDLPADIIEACPSRDDGLSPEDLLKDMQIPAEIRNIIGKLPWSGKRKHQWLYVRPQVCRVYGPDTRAGNFYHLDVDVRGHTVASAWDEFIAFTVSFGDISETEFITDLMTIDVPDAPSSGDYVTVASILGTGPYRTESAAPGRIMHYTTLDAHRAASIRRDGTRLILLGFETDGSNWK